MKYQYTAAIEAAGFKDITVLKEEAISLDCLDNDPSIQALVQNENIPPQELAALHDSVKSILISGVKP